MYKLIATDCDGTILNSKGHLPQEIVQTFKLLNKMGIHIIVATGRSDILAKDYLDEMNINCPIIGCNGATIRNLYTNTEFFSSYIPKDVLIKVFNIAKNENISLKVFTNDTFYTNNKLFYNGGIELIVTEYTKKLNYCLKKEFVKDIYSISNLPNVTKIVVIENDQNRLSKIKNKINLNIPEITATQSNWNCIDINSSLATKGNAVLAYANMLNIDKKDIIAFGDSENDISMLKAVGFGVAMKNASDIVKKSANYVTDTNDNFGVAQYLKHIYNI